MTLRTLLKYSAVICALIVSVSAYSQSGISDNDRFNAFVLELNSSFLEERKPELESIVVRKAKYKDGIYQNLVRFWFKDDTYINFLNEVYPSKEAATVSLKSEYEGSYGSARFNWDAIQTDATTIKLNVTSSTVLVNDTKSQATRAIQDRNRFIEGLFTSGIQHISNYRLSKPDGRNTVFHLPFPVNSPESVRVKICRRDAIYEEDYTIDPVRQLVVFTKPPKRGKKIKVSYNTEYNDFSFAFSFDRLSFNPDHSRLQGYDSEDSRSNASFISGQKYVDFTCSFGKAWPELVSSPTDINNKVLYFRVESPNDHSSGQDKVRISGNVKTVPSSSFTNIVDVFIPKDWEILEDYEDKIDWLTQQEYWCATAGIPRNGYPQFRMTVGMLKNKGIGEKLYYYLKCQDLFTTVNVDGSRSERYETLYEVDHRKDRYFPIPLGEWFRVTTEVISGDKNSGRFRMTVTTSNGKQHVIFDETCPTHATGYDVAGANEALYTSLSPLKLYTSSKIYDFFRDNNESFGIYYDNWTFIGRCVKHE